MSFGPGAPLWNRGPEQSAAGWRAERREGKHGSYRGIRRERGEKACEIASDLAVLGSEGVENTAR